MKRLFWALVHLSSVVIVLSGVETYLTANTIITPAKASPVTLVKGTTTFRSETGVPDPNETLSLVNAYRQANGLNLLVADPILSRIAEERAGDMSSRLYYSHKNPDGINFFQTMEDEGIAPQYACENLALESSMEEKDYVESWQYSRSGHNECLLNQSVTRAGYASRKLYDVPTEYGVEQYFVIVAIHGTN